MIQQRHSRNEHGEPQLTLTVTGTDDVYRLAHHLTFGQCEFADTGRRTIRYLKRIYRRDGWRQLMRRFHGDGGYR